MPAVATTMRRRMMTDSKCQRSFEDIPGDLDPLPQEDFVKVLTDSVNYFNDKYSITEQHGLSSPIMKTKGFDGVDSVVLLSHDAVKQWQQYELCHSVRSSPSRFQVIDVSIVYTIYNIYIQMYVCRLQHRAKRTFVPELTKLSGRTVAELSGPAHTEWRKKVCYTI